MVLASTINPYVEKLLNKHIYPISFANQLTELIQYDENPISIQRQIELSITNGRGYLSLQGALEVVNQSEPNIDLVEVAKDGMIPIYFHEPIIESTPRNPCAEIPLGEPQEMNLQFRLPTLLEGLRTLQFIKHDKWCSEHGYLS